MTDWSSVNEVLDFAIAEEQAAAEFYTRLAGQMTKPMMQQVFETFAQEEVGHKKKLQAVREGGAFEAVEGSVADLKIAEYVIDIEPATDMDYQQALLVAMKKEKAAFKLYKDLAASTDSGHIRQVFLTLAQEEAKHKLYFEVEYDDMLTDN